jgi:demethylmenaquinone methyltransferase / 2-methoxy-6-polyprenyl-1,4-benzoquinol methylase
VKSIQPQTERVVGTAPAGAGDEAAAASAVREMFTAIAPRYDLANHLLSFNIDRYWWWRTARSFRHILARPSARALDLCCGTADLARALRRRAVNSSSIVGIDFSHAMLVRAAGKTLQDNIRLAEADALRLPFPDVTFDLLTSAFGFRNLANYDAGLREMHRVLRAGGEIGILDFGEPDGLMGKAYRVYFRHVLPKLGALISGVRGPYAYLPASVKRFPSPDEMLGRMQQAGFRDVSWQPFTFGIAGLFRGKK